jgi:hypothetical protein
LLGEEFSQEEGIMAMNRKGAVNRVLSKVALVGGTAVVSCGIAISGAGMASAAPGETIDQQIGHAGSYYNHQIGQLGTFLNHQVGKAGTYYSVQAGRAGSFALKQTGRTVKGLINSLLGKKSH